MGTDTAILAALAGTPGHSIHGKKRLQKILSIAKDLGEQIDTEFKLSHYGPFSPDVANFAELLYFLGKIDCTEEQIGPNGYFTTVYALAQGTQVSEEVRLQRLAAYLSRYGTVELEIASTLSHFLKNSSLPKAETRTKEFKREKASNQLLAKAREILDGAKRLGG